MEKDPAIEQMARELEETRQEVSRLTKTAAAREREAQDSYTKMYSEYRVLSCVFNPDGIIANNLREEKELREISANVGILQTLVSQAETAFARWSCNRDDREERVVRERLHDAFALVKRLVDWLPAPRMIVPEGERWGRSFAEIQDSPSSPTPSQQEP